MNHLPPAPTQTNPSEHTSSYGHAVNNLLPGAGKSRNLLFLFATWTTVSLSIVGVVYYLLKLLILSQVFLADAERITNAEIVAFGEFVNWPTEDDVQAKSDRSSPTIPQNSKIISGALNLVFGVQFKLHGEPKSSRIPVTLRIEHPRFTSAPLPSNKTIDEWETIAISGEPGEIAWMFEYPWEVVPGEWRFSVVYKGREVLTQTFEVDVGNEVEENSPADDEGRISL